MEAVLQSLRGFGAGRLFAIVGFGVALLIFFAFLTMRVSSGVMAPLYTSLPMEEGAKVTAELDKMGIKYQLRAEGTQILVPTDMVLNLRMQMAGKGLPAQGSIVGYEVFDKADSLGTSSFVYNVNMLRALEGELGRTIGTFDWVDQARVHLVLPKRELFSREKDKASASVIIKLKGSKSPTAEQVSAIKHLVGSSVPELDLSRVTVVDSRGKLLSKGVDNPDDPSVAADNALEFRVNFERRLQGTIEELLENSLGAGNAKVQVSADVNFDRVITNSETYDPEGGVPRSVQTTEEKESSTDREPQAVTVASNLPDAKAKDPSAPSSQSDSQKTEEVTNFEISKVTKNQVQEGNNVKRLSVAVLVDGIYAMDETTKKKTYQPRSAEELTQIASLVKSSIGFDEKRGDKVEVVNMPFSDEFTVEEPEAPFAWVKRDFDSILKTLVIGAVAIMVILMVIKPLVNRAFEIAPADDAEGAAILASGGPDMSALLGKDDVEDDPFADIIAVKTGAAAIKKVIELANSNPEETMAVLRGWMLHKK